MNVIGSTQPTKVAHVLIVNRLRCTERALLFYRLRMRNDGERADFCRVGRWLLVRPVLFSDFFSWHLVVSQ